MILSESRDNCVAIILRDNHLIGIAHDLAASMINKMFYYVYLLENVFDKSWYIGYTSNINKRVKDHNEGRGGKTTRQGKLWELIYFEGYRVEKDAIGRENF